MSHRARHARNDSARASARSESCRRSGSTDAASRRCRASRRAAVQARAQGQRRSRRCSFGLPFNLKAGLQHPASKVELIAVEMKVWLLFRFLAERFVDLVFLDTGGGVSGLAEI